MTKRVVSRAHGAVASLAIVVLMSASMIAVAVSGTAAGNTVVSDDETVYVVCDASGGVEDVVVVDWLRLQGDGEVAVTDHGDAYDVEAIQDDVDPVVSDGDITWTLDVDGTRDFFYRAKTDNELPLEVDVTYSLDGVETSPEDLAGESGHLRIDVQLTNRLSVVEDIAYQDAYGVAQVEETEYWVPMLAPVVIDVDGTRFSNIEAEAEIVTVTGSTISHTFMAFPQPDATVTIEMDSDDIAIKPIIVTAFPKMAGSPDFSTVEELDDLRVGIEGLGLLTSGQMQVLTAMTDQLDLEQYGDIAGQMEMFDELIDGIGQLSTGADGLVMLVDGQTQYLDGVIGGLESQEYDEIAQLPSVLETMTAQIQATKSGLDGVITLLDGQRAYLDGISASNAGIQSLAQVHADASGDTTVTTIATQLAAQQVMIDALRTGNESAGLPYGLDYTSAQLTQISAGLGQIASAMETITVGAAELTTFPDQMDALVDSLKTLRDGGDVMGQPMPGLVDTKAGLQGVAFGLAEMHAGLSGSTDELQMLAELPASLAALRDTLLALRDGGQVQGVDLPGLSTTEGALNEIALGLGEGVSEGHYGEATIGALEDAADAYDTFLGKPEDVGESDVRFLYKLEGIGE